MTTGLAYDIARWLIIIEVTIGFFELMRYRPLNKFQPKST